MQPVQDLTHRGQTVSKTQYQFILQDADSGAARRMDPQLVDRLRQLPQLGRCRQRHLQSRAFDSLSKSIAIRPPASALRRRRSTMRFMTRTASASFPPSLQSNQYRVILEADPRLQTSLQSLSDIILPPRRHYARAAGRVWPDPRGNRAAADLASRQFPASTVSFNLARALPRRGGDREQAGGRPKLACRSGVISSLSRRSPRVSVLPFKISSSDSGGDRHRLYRAGVLYESFIHPSPSSRRCHPPESARCWHDGCRP